MIEALKTMTGPQIEQIKKGLNIEPFKQRECSDGMGFGPEKVLPKGKCERMEISLLESSVDASRSLRGIGSSVPLFGGLPVGSTARGHK